MKKVFGLLCISALFTSLVSCADVDSRNNPTDPMADNFEVVILGGDEDSSSSVNSESSSSDEISSSSYESLSSAEEESSGSVEPESSSSSVISSGSEESSSSFDSSSSVEPESSSSIVSSSSVESSSSIESSGSVESSSSVAEFICGESKMVRGSIEYNTVEILNTCWTAENMKNELSSVETFTCYDNDPANCEKYGMMYSYEAASSICPTGWRLPETKDLQDMLDYSGEWNDWAGMYLKSKEGWEGNAETGTDALGFNALPGGGYTNEGFRGLGKYGIWWTSSKKTTTSHYVLKLTGDDDSFYATGNAMENDFYAYVRCIRK